MFSLVVRYLGFLKFIPLFPHLYDSMLKLWALVTRSEILDCIDEIEAEVIKWTGTTISMHKYGGVQFNYNGKEIGHIHSNGILDIPYSRKIKQQLMEDQRIQQHHVFKNSGWISFYLKRQEDVRYAKELLLISYKRRYLICQNNSGAPGDTTALSDIRVTG